LKPGAKKLWLSPKTRNAAYTMKMQAVFDLHTQLLQPNAIVVSTK
jgi:hypothetical protein